ncbi:DUF6779 domain-containing protein [Mycobacterium sp. UM_CSW]|uniref:DUF6779 domain-containing protein n=1 Tax=Mycobacterium sp. UM_CSW TaxID=1370119 RepID=UPI0004260FE1|nr:DUF6779 domain-containing protein [Mycobacterium sp. UM_CSW]
MTVLSRGARVRRGGRRPGWVLLTALLVLAMGASSALVFTNRVELLKLAVILALWAAVAGAFVSVLYRRQSDADQSRVRDLKLVYDLQLDREISARREYELTVESQLRRELASELRAQAEDDLAALRAELSALRTSLEILFDTDLQQRPAIETHETEAPRGRAYSEWERIGESNPDWVPSDRVASVARDNPDEAAIIDVPEEPLLPPRQPPPPRERFQYDVRQDARYVVSQEPPYMTPPPAPEQPRYEQRQPPPPPQAQPQPQMPEWQPPAAGAESPGGRRARHYGAEETLDGSPFEHPQAPPYGETGRRARSRHSAEYRDYGVSNFPPQAGGTPTATNEPAPPPPPQPGPPPPPPQMAPPPHAEAAPRHRGTDPLARGSDGADDSTPSGGQSVAELLARLQVEPSGGGRRRRRDG